MISQQDVQQPKFDEQEAQRIEALIEAVENAPHGDTGVISAYVHHSMSRGEKKYLVYLRSKCVFERLELNSGVRIQSTFKPGAWVAHLEALPEKLRQQDAQYKREREEEEKRQLAESFTPIDDAALFADPQPVEEETLVTPKHSEHPHAPRFVSFDPTFDRVRIEGETELADLTSSGWFIAAEFTATDHSGNVNYTARLERLIPLQG